MRNTHQHIVTRIKLLKLPNTPLRLIVIVTKAPRDIVERLRSTGLGVNLLDQERARTARPET